MKALLLRNALCCTPSPATVRPADIRIVNGAIEETGPSLELRSGESVEDLQGAMVLPGSVCAHTHLYSSLSRGMPGPVVEPSDFPAMLASIWWKLDRALDAESIRASALAGALEAVRCGVTTVVDHHASPNAIPGSLSIIAEALETVGLRGILCYETSDRDGAARRDQGLAENQDFVALRRGHPLVRGLVGAHASFTLSEQTLAALGAIVDRLDSGLHVHVAEDRADADITRNEHGRGIVDRLRLHGLLRPRSVFAHCIHLDPPAYAALRDAGVWMVHNPRSNMNNAVGHAPLDLFGPRSALGSDGFPADMFEEARTAYFRNREAPGRLSPDGVLRMASSGGTLVSEIFGRPVGMLEPGAAADLMVLDYPAPTPLTPQTLPAHLMFGLRSGMVHSVMINGVWVLRDRTFTRVNERDVVRDAVRAAGRLWRAMHG